MIVRFSDLAPLCWVDEYDIVIPLSVGGGCAEASETES